MRGSLGVYVHFPWCVAKCPYCDFNSHPLTGALPEHAYVGGLEQNIDAAAATLAGREITSIFFGGGTPSLFSPQAIGRLIDRLAPWLAADAEITLEANPGTTEHQALGGYRQAGVNRLSLGAQSFDADQLRGLGRIHSPEDTLRAVEAARRGGFDNLNLDLMYGLPGQTTAAALADLDAALALAPTHLSWYQLTIEPRTEFARRPPRLPGEEPLIDMEMAGLARLEAADFARYEVSAFAHGASATDLRCRHNLNYWTFGDYLGLGAGAHGKLRDGNRVLRTWRPRQPRLFLADPDRIETRLVGARELPGEFMLGALRLVSGVDEAAFEPATGLTLSALEPERTRLTRMGLLEPGRLQATEAGYRVLDSVVSAFL